MRPIKEVMQPIKRECTVCRNIYELHYSQDVASQRFCERKCYVELRQCHKGMRDYWILTVLRERGKLTAMQISNLLSGVKVKSSNRTVGNVLRLWVARGMVTCSRPSFKKPYTYKYISESHPGELVIQYAKA